MTGNYHGSIHVLINLSSLYQSLVQLLKHDRAISCPLNSNLLNILLLGGGGSGLGKRGGAGGPVGWARGLGPWAGPVAWPMGLVRPGPLETLTVTAHNHH